MPFIPKVVILWMLVAVPFAFAAETFDPGLFAKHLRLIHTSGESNYAAQLSQLFSKVNREGATLADVMSASHAVGLPVKDFLTAAVESYPARDVIALLIQNSDDAEEIVKIAVFADIDPKTIIEGAVAAGIQPVDAEVLVAVALKLKREKARGASADKDGKSGLARTPGEELDSSGDAAGASGAAGAAGTGGGADAGGAAGAAGPAGGASGPVGGAGRGVASPS